MKSTLIFLLSFYSLSMMAQNPSMQIWTKAWRDANSESLKMIYSKNAAIFPPSKPTVKGNKNILQFMSGGMGKVDVFFEPENLIICENLAFEFGIFKDVALDTQKTIGKGNYSVTWIRENDTWSILCHSWSMPKRN